MIKVDDPLVQRELINLTKNKAPKQLPVFEGLNAELINKVGERESFIIKDGTNYYSAKIIDGKLFRGNILTEVT